MFSKRCFLVFFASIFLIFFSSNLFADILHDVVTELNFVRTRPQEYAQKRLVPRLKNYKGLDYHIDSKSKVPTKEGAVACKECIEVLKKQKPLLPLTMDKLLCVAANILAKDQAKTGKVGHVGSDGSQLQDRLAKAHFMGSVFSEVTAYGPTDAIEIVAKLMIGDGVPTRGHRVNILDSDFDKVGVAFVKGGKAIHGSVCVIDFGGGVEQNASSQKQNSDKKAGSSASKQNAGKKGENPALAPNKDKKGGNSRGGSSGGKKGKEDEDDDVDYDGENDDEDGSDDIGIDDGDYDVGGDYDGGGDYGD